jgi:phage portal protein BeeE
MGIWAGIVAIFQTIGEAIGLSKYWLNPKERQRRRKKEMLDRLQDLESKRDALYHKGATEGFTRPIDIEMAKVEKEIKDLKREIKAVQ